MTDQDPWEEYEAWHFKHIEAAGPTSTAMEAKKQLDECLDEYARVKRALFLPGFCDFVIKQGFGAASPIKINGRPESWQMCGRRLWGTKHFDDAMKDAIARSRASRTAARTSRESSQS